MLTLSGILLSALVTLSVYSVLAPTIFAEAKMRELAPRAQFLAEQTALYIKSDAAYTGQLNIDTRQWGASVYIYDQSHQLISGADELMSFPFYPARLVDFDRLLDHVLSGEPLSTLEHMILQVDNRRESVDLLIIGIPVVLDGQVVGAVIMMNSLKEITSAMSSLLSTLWFSVIAVSMLMVPLAYWFAMLISRPIWNMRDVAMRMVNGDFSVRGDDVGMGEIGDLARALNTLSSQLDSTIAELTQERNQAVVIVNALSEGVLAVDSNGRPTQTNPALQSMLCAADSGKPAQLPPEVWADYRVALTENRCVERRFELNDMQIYLTITPIRHEIFGVTHAIGVFHDETQAQRLEQTRRDYVANVSHELKTPLTALRAMVEPLRDGLIRTEEKRLETYDIILRETMRLTRLVDDMLELSRLQRGRLALEKMRFTLLPLLHDIASVYAAKAAETGHILSLEVPDKPLPTVMGNADRVEQVLVALLNNAFAYTPPGSHIILRTEVFPEYLHIIVEDNGPGINPIDLPHVFERFYKADKSHSGSGGTGLGLAIASELMQRLGEEMTVQNRPEGGARFAFSLHYE